MKVLSQSLWAVATAGVLLTGCADVFDVDTAEVRRGSIQQYVDERGKTRLPESHLISMPYDGRIEAIELVEGDRVAANQIVAEIVPLDLELAYEAADAAVQRLAESIEENADTRVEDVIKVQAESFVASMKSTVDAAEARKRAGREKADFGKATYERTKKAYDQGAATADELGRAEVLRVESEVDHQQDVLVYEAMKSLYAATSLFPRLVDRYVETKGLAGNVLQKQKLEAQKQLAMQEQRKKRGVMRSPIDGVVLEREVSNERYLPAGRTLLRIGRPSDLEVEADVLSQDVGSISVGDAVEIYGPAIGTPPAIGKVSRVYPEGFTKTSSLGVEQQRVKVIVRFAEDDLARLQKERNLGVEFRVRVRIMTATADDALIVPRSALFRSANGDWEVFVVSGGVAKRQTVEVGLMNDEFAQVTSGLDESAEVVAVPESGLKDGTRVN
ncbi:MAG: HlyD family efflux transporter periplasmic adaptor subunit [Pirellulales bacterium]|nr:HlyD family efflux transporter periplasmic adaptor subunit [Pirellulales bacterium]